MSDGHVDLINSHLVDATRSIGSLFVLELDVAESFLSPTVLPPENNFKFQVCKDVIDLYLCCLISVTAPKCMKNERRSSSEMSSLSP